MVGQYLIARISGVFFLAIFFLGCGTTGYSATSAVGLSVNQLNFSTQVAGTTSGARQITLTNQTQRRLTILISVSAGFAQSNNCSQLSSGAQCTINVAFGPSGVGPVTGSLTVTSASRFGSIATTTINLSGIGVPPVVISPMATATFAASVGKTSSATTLTLTNYQSVPLTIFSIVSSGNFVQTNNCGSSLAALASCAILVTFSPKFAGTVPGALTITDDANGSPHVLALSGGATGSPVSPLTYSPARVSLSNQIVGTTSAAKPVTVTNNGPALTISNVTASGNYSQDGACSGVTLLTGQACTMNVTFRPTIDGNTSGAITLTDDAATSPHVVQASGVGVLSTSLSSSSLNFGGMLVGNTSATKSTILTNNSSSPVSISSIVASAGYLQSNNCATSLGAGASCTISVKFTPTQAGTFNGSVSIASSASSRPQILSLYGTGLLTTSLNPTQVENAAAGDSSWQITNLATHREIEGYASESSINHGEAVNLFVNTAAPTYALDIYRLGWYGGSGARRMLPTITLAVVQQPAPSIDPVTRMVECSWISPYTLNVPSTWPSGVYMAKLTATGTGKQAGIIFVVRDDARSSNILFQVSLNTDQAYNDWGGYSLYTVPQAYKVSFNRPYFSAYWGLGEFPRWGINLVRFLEREGYDVSYVADVDTHINGSLLLKHKVFVSVPHDEYWSGQMRDNVEAARAAGIGLAFLGANTGYWQVRFEPSPLTGAANRTMVSYKSAALDPFNNDGNPNDKRLVTVRFRDSPVNRPENLLVGVMYQSSHVSGDVVLSAASHFLFQNTGLRNGDHFFQMLGYELDTLFSNTPAGTQVLASSPYFNGTQSLLSDMTIYTSPAGSLVFATGTMQWVWGLDDWRMTTTIHPILVDPAVQQITRNLFKQFGAVSPSQ